MDATYEEERAMAGLAEARNAEAAESASKQIETAEITEAPANISEVVWFFVGGFALLGWLTGLLASFFLFNPIVTIVINFGTVFLLWFWAQINGLRPPSFSSNLKKGSALISPVAGQGVKTSVGGAAEKLEEAVPGSSLLYILLGGSIHPLLYALALFLNNR